MQVVVVRSPGLGAAPHWSAGFADELGQLLAARGDAVRQLLPGRPEQAALPAAAVAAGNCDMQLECDLTTALREWPQAAVVHVGVGARGTPNVLWIADRLGSRAIACARGDELVCARGDLRDRDGLPCAEFVDAARCRRCCTTSWRRRPHLPDLQNRTDLCVASLLVAELTFVRDDVDRQRLASLGLPAARMVIGLTPAAVAARL
ncbi:MAG: hypothetical protein H6835_10340 [Planctomycetes bacterium]|nr:hypothetical protein [Planctomycetota bacterium]